jgi:hypothetical protein
MVIELQQYVLCGRFDFAFNISDFGPFEQFGDVIAFRSKGTGVISSACSGRDLEEAEILPIRRLLSLNLFQGYATASMEFVYPRISQ